MDTINDPLPRLTAYYLEYLQDFDTARLVANISRHYDQAALVRLASAQRVETRRAAAIALGFLGNYQANPTLGRLLLDGDRSVRLLAENSIKNIWPRDGIEEQRHELREIMRLIGSERFDEAVRRANNLLDEAPLYAEARNQRAIALFALGDFEESIEDSAIVLDLNPFHFGAAIGMGHAYLQLHDKELAVASFQHALLINPSLESVRRHLERITQNG